MSLCPNCGRELIEGSRFCSWCGKDLQPVVTEPVIEPEIPQAPLPPPVPLPQVHPWLRYFARTFDLSTATVVFLACTRLAGLDLKAPAAFFANTAVFAVYFTLESLLIWRLATTPGKALFRIHVQTKSGERREFSACWRRSLGVFVRGVALGIPFVMLAAQFFSYVDLVRHGQAAWDRDFGFRVEHGRIGVARTVLIVICFSVLAALLAAFLLGGIDATGPAGDV